MLSNLGGALASMRQASERLGTDQTPSIVETGQKLKRNNPYIICFIAYVYSSTTYQNQQFLLWPEKVVSVFGFGRSKSHFRAPENGHFWHFQVPENGTLSARIQKRRPLFHANTPPKWRTRHLFHVFATFGSEISKF